MLIQHTKHLIYRITANKTFVCIEVIIFSHESSLHLVLWTAGVTVKAHSLAGVFHLKVENKGKRSNVMSWPKQGVSLL